MAAAATATSAVMPVTSHRLRSSHSLTATHLSYLLGRSALAELAERQCSTTQVQNREVAHVRVYGVVRTHRRRAMARSHRTSAKADLGGLRRAIVQARSSGHEGRTAARFGGIQPVTSHLTTPQHSLTATHPICWVVLHWRSASALRPRFKIEPLLM